MTLKLEEVFAYGGKTEEYLHNVASIIDWSEDEMAFEFGDGELLIIKKMNIVDISVVAF